MDVKEYLLQAFTINKILKARQTQVEELKEQRFTIGTSLDGDKVQSSPNNDKIGDLSAKLLDLINEYTDDLNRLLELKSEIRGLIGKLGSPTHRVIMEERYINLKRWEDIAADNNYSWRRIHEIHAESLKQLKERIEPHTLDMI